VNLLEAILLGGIQGLTEFLPVSSSGHLVVAQDLFGFDEPMLAFNIAVHWGTIVAVFIYFAKDLIRICHEVFLFLIKFPFSSDRVSLSKQYPYAIVGGLILVASIPTAIIGLLFEDTFEYLFQSVISVSIAWLVMGVFLLMSSKFRTGDRNICLMNQRDAFLIGIAQGIAIIPGVSRSGITILAGMLCGVEKKDAARFSFLLAIPAVVGAGLLKFKAGVEFISSNASFVLAGFITSAVVGYLAITVLLKFVAQGKLYLFGYYCILISLASFAYVSISEFSL